MRRLLLRADIITLLSIIRFIVIDIDYDYRYYAHV